MTWISITKQHSKCHKLAYDLRAGMTCLQLFLCNIIDVLRWIACKLQLRPVNTPAAVESQGNRDCPSTCKTGSDLNEPAFTMILRQLIEWSTFLVRPEFVCKDELRVSASDCKGPSAIQHHFWSWSIQFRQGGSIIACGLLWLRCQIICLSLLWWRICYTSKLAQDTAKCRSIYFVSFLVWSIRNKVFLGFESTPPGFIFQLTSRDLKTIGPKLLDVVLWLPVHPMYSSWGHSWLHECSSLFKCIELQPCIVEHSLDSIGNGIWAHHCSASDTTQVYQVGR